MGRTVLGDIFYDSQAGETAPLNSMLNFRKNALTNSEHYSGNGGYFRARHRIQYIQGEVRGSTYMYTLGAIS